MRNLLISASFILGSLCSCNQNDSKQNSGDNKQGSTQGQPVNTITKDWDCVASAVRELQADLQNKDSIKIANQANFPLSGIGNTDTVTKQTFLKYFSKVFPKEVRDFMTSLNFDTLKLNRSADLNFYSHLGYNGEYLKTDSCADGIYLRIGDENKSFYLNINKNVYNIERADCSESAIIIQFLIDDQCKFRLVGIQQAG